MDSHHYPIIAKLQVQFSRIKQSPPSSPKYTDRSIWRDKDKLGKTILEFMKNKALKSHNSWNELNE